MIAEALKGKTILVTGTTGFLGKSIVEKCLRSIPEVGRINLAIRSSARRPAAERLEREVLSSPAFKRLKEELGEEAFAKLVNDEARRASRSTSGATALGSATPAASSCANARS